MKILLTGINAKFIHSCLAVHTLSAYARQQYGIPVETQEYTINQLREDILADLYRRSPDLLGFSCYIWNISLIRELIGELKQVLPETLILLGGPEVSFDPEDNLRNTKADFILTGEGEESFSQLCLALEQRQPLDRVPGLVRRGKNGMIHTPPPPPLDLSKLPFAYEDFSLFENRILYYEAQRGCPFHCQYCLSSLEKGVRFQPLDKVCRELQIFLDHRVRQVKFVDRTFNADPAFAIAIWRYLQQHDNGVTNFHFELEADLLTDDMLDFLPSVRPGLFQFEIGVQSTHAPTLSAIQRPGDFPRLAEKVRTLRQKGNIHIHLDLIAGLPYENLQQFKASFNDVYALQPEQLQLGFLKLLKGSGLRRDQEKFGITARQEPPYEVLFTRELPFSHMLILKDVESLTEQYYNSCQFRTALVYLCGLAPSPFDFYLGFSAFCREGGLFERQPSRMERFDILYRYGSTLPGCRRERLAWLLKFDLCSREKPRKLPPWMPETDEKARIYHFYEQPEVLQRFLPEYAGLDPRLVSRMAHLEFFPFDPRSNDDPGSRKERETAVLFNYRKTDILGNALTVFLSQKDL